MINTGSIIGASQTAALASMTKMYKTAFKNNNNNVMLNNLA